MQHFERISIIMKCIALNKIIYFPIHSDRVEQQFQNLTVIISIEKEVSIVTFIEIDLSESSMVFQENKTS